VRIFQALIGPRGGLGLTLLAFALAFVALLLDQANFKSPVLVWVFGILAVLAALGALVAFFGPQIAKLRKVRFRWPFVLNPAVERSASQPEPEWVTGGEQETAEQRAGYWDNRQMLHAALKDFWAETDYMGDEDVYDDDEVKEWEDRTAQLILEALGQERVDEFLTNDIQISRVGPDDSPRQAWVKYRQAQLGILTQVIDSLCRLEIRPDFDGRKWVGSEQYRFKQGKAY
jgi:hypothetical protein